MSAPDTVSTLSSFGTRASGSDAERRTALWLARELESRGRSARVEPFWCRPNWALAHAWHVALGLAGSLIAVSEPTIGGALLLVALLSVVSDELTGWSPGRRLTPERASQNVVSEAEGDHRLRMVVTANYDAGRTGLAYRAAPRRAARGLRRLSAGRAPGWLGWITVALIWLLVIAILRLGGAGSDSVGIPQLIPTVGLVLALAALLELASAETGPAAADNGSGVAVALALVRALDAAPPRRLAIEVVLEGAGEGGGIGLRRYLRRRRRTATNTIVLGIAPCGAGHPRWWVSDGALVPLRYHSRLRALSARVAAAEPGLLATPWRGRGETPALRARMAGLPALAIGCLDEAGLVPRSHTKQDTVALLDQAALDSALELALMLVDAIDAEFARAPTGARSRPAPTRS
jgi:hypothetical protein